MNFHIYSFTKKTEKIVKNIIFFIKIPNFNCLLAVKIVYFAGSNLGISTWNHIVIYLINNNMNFVLHKLLTDF